MKPNLYHENAQNCAYCKADTFHFVQIDTCKTCENNGIKEGDGYAYRTLKEGEERTEVSDDGECLLGHAGEGCTILVCSICDRLHIHIPIYSS